MKKEPFMYFVEDHLRIETNGYSHFDCWDSCPILKVTLKVRALIIR